MKNSLVTVIPNVTRINAVGILSNGKSFINASLQVLTSINLLSSSLLSTISCELLSNDLKQALYCILNSKSTLDVSFVVNKIYAAVCKYFVSNLNIYSFLLFLLKYLVNLRELESIISCKLLIIDTCTSCHNISKITSTSEVCIFVNTHSKTLQNALNHRTRVVTNTQCSVCSSFTTHIEETIYLSFPPVLFFIVNNPNLANEENKYTDFTYPIDSILDLSNFTATKKSAKYKLSAVIFSKGSNKNSHSVCCVRITEKWFYIDDAFILHITGNTVNTTFNTASRNLNVLCYERL